MKYLTYIVTTSILPLFIVFGVQAQVEQVENDFATWDADDNEYVDDQELSDAFDQNEYYLNWDSDSDGTLTEEEWRSGVDTYYPEYTEDDYGTFNAWDRNNDATLDNDEWMEGTFELWDEDQDGLINVDEYSTVYNDDLY